MAPIMVLVMKGKEFRSYILPNQHPVSKVSIHNNEFEST